MRESVLSAKSSPAEADDIVPFGEASARDVMPRGRRVCRYVVGSAQDMDSGVVNVWEDFCALLTTELRLRAGFGLIYRRSHRRRTLDTRSIHMDARMRGRKNIPVVRPAADERVLVVCGEYQACYAS